MCGRSASGVYSIHINAFFDLDAHIYTDAILQPVHEKKRIWRILRHRGPARDSSRQEECLHWRQGRLLLQQHGTCGGTV